MDRKQLARNIVSGDRARRRMQLTGMSPNGHPLWIPPEKNSLERNHPDYDTALAEIKRRTRHAAHSKASRMKITAPAPPRWDVENEKPKMRRLYPTSTKQQLMAAFPGRSWGAICARARGWGIWRDKAKPVSRGVALLDAIVARGMAMNYSLADLGRLGHRPTFFLQKRTTIIAADWTCLSKVIRALGGHLRAGWPGQE